MMEGLIKNGNFLDLGCGTGSEPAFAAESGFTVTAVDRNPLTEEVPNITFVQSLIEDFVIEEGKYDVIFADNALPFLTKDNAKKVLIDASSKIKPDGTMSFTLFGANDAWAKDENMSSKMNFWDREEAYSFVKGLNLPVYRTDDEEGFAPTMKGEIKYWHIFKFILKK